MASRAPGGGCGPPSHLGWCGDPRLAALCRGSGQPGRGEPGKRGPRGGRAPLSPYRRLAGGSPRHRRAARPALFPPAPPAAPGLPPRPQSPPPPPAPPRSLIDGSSKKSPRSRAASAGERRHSRNPSAPPDGAAPPRARCGHTRAPRTRQPARLPARSVPGDAGGSERRRGGGRGKGDHRDSPHPAPRKENAPTRKVRERNQRTRQSPTLFFRRRGGGLGVSLTQVR